MWAIFNIDCERMPGAADLKGHETEVIEVAGQSGGDPHQQTRLFDYMLSKHPTDFTMLVQSCEDRTGH